MDYFSLFRNVCESLGDPIWIAVDTMNVVPLPQLPIDRKMTEKALGDFTNQEWDATSLFFSLNPEDPDVIGLNESVWQAFGSPPSLSLLLVSLTDSLESAGFFKELPGIAVPEVSVGAKAQVQTILPTSDRLRSVCDDQFVFRVVALLVGRLGFKQGDLEDAIAAAFESEAAAKG